MQTHFKDLSNRVYKGKSTLQANVPEHCPAAYCEEQNRLHPAFSLIRLSQHKCSLKGSGKGMRSEKWQQRVMSSTPQTQDATADNRVNRLTCDELICECACDFAPQRKMKKTWNMFQDGVWGWKRQRAKFYRWWCFLTLLISQTLSPACHLPPFMLPPEFLLMSPPLLKIKQQQHIMMTQRF